MLVCDKGENTYPAPPYEPPPAPVAAESAVEETKKAPAWASYLTAAMRMSARQHRVKTGRRGGVAPQLATTFSSEWIGRKA